MKSYEKKKRQSRSSSSDVPKLRAQKKQTIETLIVERTTQQDFITFLKQSNLTVAQIVGGEAIPMAQVVTRWEYKLGTALVPPDVVSLLSMQMQRLHKQYMLAMSRCIFMQGAKIKDEDFFWGEAIIWINWEEVYQLYHQDTLDIPLVGLWVL